MKILNGKKTRDELKEAVEASNENKNKVRFAVAFWGKGIIEDLSIDPANTEIVCNLSMGGTNPDVIEELLTRGAVVRHSNQLHSKLYLTDSIGVIGSSNASANGLSMEGEECSGWLETNIVFSAEEDGELYGDAETHFKSIWTAATPLCGSDDPVLAKARDAWKKKRHSNPFIGVEEGESLLWHIKNKPEVLEDGHEVYIVISRGEGSKEYWSQLSKEQKKFDGNTGSAEESKLDAYEDFEDLPEDAFLIDFYIGPRLGSFMFMGFYERTSGLADVEIEGTDTLMQLCWGTDEIAGIKNVDDGDAWKPLIRKLVDPDGDGEVFSIREFIDKVGHLF